MAAPSLDRETILHAVRSWPLDQQRAFAQEIMQHVGPSLIEEPLVPPDSQGLAGLLANGRTPPTDDEIERWLDERRIEKYGR